ncbi:hypothetical protein OG792_32875 [Micromonospora sp. NBC_01699]|uniref:hypothetical protein n=1 Tax=Micromonospora sp. NBC_01699 TaxID=2975984 RepID=UPI002E2B025D|nr:hypothetical protein [Micromonospora sp. NBC_01699]
MPLTSPDPSSDLPPEVQVQIWFARLEAKLDIALSQHADHETRLREIERRPVVTPRAMWVGLAAVGGLVAAAQPFLDRLYAN